MRHCDARGQVGALRVTKGQGLFVFSVMSSLTVEGRKGLNHTEQTD